MPKWTKEQTEAIVKSGENIIVSAGAGSGKTAVLSERVLNKIENNIHINDLANALEQTVGQISLLLFSLEMKGAVRCLAGSMYHLIK